MLALARKLNESIIINDNIEVTLLEIKGDQVKLGISAPKSVPVCRKELYVQIKEANKESVEKAATPETVKELMDL
ncbi:MAG: carbon storage regulator CsrA [Lachnospiraceae bacterium]|nr:carbon storage regulator CsrA [Lachnospiraceae bacterium]